MTHTTQGGRLHPQEASAPSLIYQSSAVDSASDNDASEKSAREKFKKTSLASLSNRALPSEGIPEGATKGAATRAFEPAESARVPLQENTATEQTQGRDLTQRPSYDDNVDLASPQIPATDDSLPDSSNGGAKKLSNNVGVDDGMEGGGQSSDERKASLKEADGRVGQAGVQGSASQKHHVGSPATGDDDNTAVRIPLSSKSEEGAVLPDAEEEQQDEGGISSKVPTIEADSRLEDEEMRDGAYSPRKKRSRDQMDNEADREQKIAATEETRAQRRSDEIDRADVSSYKSRASLKHGPDPSRTAVSRAGPLEDNATSRNTSEPVKATFGATNMLRPVSGPSQSKSPTNNSQDGEDRAKDKKITAPSAFASSGFASFASSSNSPFSAAGSTPEAAMPRASAAVEPSAAETSEPQNPAPEPSGGFGSFAKMQSSGFGTNPRSPFATVATNTGGVFGQSVFGSSFGSGFATGSKLSSFAAPIGDARLGSANGSVKPSGTSNNESDEKPGSESEGDREDYQSRDDETSEADDRFQHQDVETGEDGEDTLFSSRAKLYAFKDNNWKEAGIGVFKLNVMSSETLVDKEKTGRFIMRAHQTYRVLLNQPIFPQMKVGDRAGNEPTAKAFAFAMIEDGKPIPHLVRVGVSTACDP